MIKADGKMTCARIPGKAGLLKFPCAHDPPASLVKVGVWIQWVPLVKLSGKINVRC